ncbi:Uncharacterised protein [Mycobacteroides abscessus subsp. abscessus]|nr:Uncharacterised protein [Mycobacteroides abscessus subsp. abscessus]
MELTRAQRIHIGPERSDVIHHLVSGQLNLWRHEAELLDQPDHLVPLLIARPAQHLTELRRNAAGVLRDRTEIDDAETSIGQQHEVSGVRIGMHQPHAFR